MKLYCVPRNRWMSASHAIELVKSWTVLFVVHVKRNSFPPLHLLCTAFLKLFGPFMWCLLFPESFIEYNYTIIHNVYYTLHIRHTVTKKNDRRVGPPGLDLRNPHRASLQTLIPMFRTVQHWPLVWTPEIAQHYNDWCHSLHILFSIETGPKKRVPFEK